MTQLILYSIIRALAAYLLLLALVRLMGKKVISQMTFFDFAAAVMMGTIAANLAILHQDSSVSVFVALLTLAASAMLIGYIRIKSFRAGKFFNSEPVVLVDKGEVVEQNLKRARFAINDLTALLREKNMFNMADVEFAILENDGRLSVLPKSARQPLTPSDLKIPAQYKGLTRDVIIDGEMMDENLDGSHSREWLIGQLSVQGVRDVKKVLYGGLDSSGNLYISLKDKNHKEDHGQYGIE
jgi:uncharacterized membrane protein YcaP (DUF421 family)